MWNWRLIMKVLVTGICGFVGSRVALALIERLSGLQVYGMDNLLRAGSETNREKLQKHGVRFVHGDVRMRSDVESLPPCDWVIDAAANPSILAGTDGRSSPRQLAEHNLAGTLNVIEYCRENKAGLILLSTNRVYSVRDLAALPVAARGLGFALDAGRPLPPGVSESGLSEEFPVRQPVSLYGATKLASEIMSVEYGAAFDFPVWVNRCGVLAGAGQFGTAEQGIFSYWLHAHATRRPLRYIGFGGAGHQVRDAFHPEDLAALIALEIRRDPPPEPIYNVGGGLSNSMSLAELNAWCDERFGANLPEPDLRPRPFDAPWIVMNSSRANNEIGWAPERSLHSVLEEIATHVEQHPGWLATCAAL